MVKDLLKAGIGAEAIHGNKSQNARQRALSNFKSRETRVLVATDIAARGIDVDELSHVINYELPNIPETYVHRIGRTGRAGHDGIALSFCDEEETEYLRDIHKLIGKRVPIIDNHPFPPDFDTTKVTPAPPQRQGQGRNQGRQGGGGRSNGSSNQGSFRRDDNRNNGRRSETPGNREQPRATSQSRPASQDRPAPGRRDGNSNGPNKTGTTGERPGRGTGNSRYTNLGPDKNY